ncbi:hypothetical protein [Cohnella luojiensis]|nr:hypothetical protein [Cohnella luojiensis]
MSVINFFTRVGIRGGRLAWITGLLKDISYNIQGQIDHHLEIVPASGM